jgi:hypothetical protein
MYASVSQAEVCWKIFHQNLICNSHFSMRATYPASLILLRFIAIITRMFNIVTCEGSGYIVEGSRNKSAEMNFYDQSRDS